MAKTKPFDAADYLATDEDVVVYLSEALASGAAAIVAQALDAIARARHEPVAHDTGVSRESLYRALSAEGKPELASAPRIINALGLRLTAEPTAKAA